MGCHGPFVGPALRLVRQCALAVGDLSGTLKWHRMTKWLNGIIRNEFTRGERIPVAFLCCLCRSIFYVGLWWCSCVTLHPNKLRHVYLHWKPAWNSQNCQRPTGTSLSRRNSGDSMPVFNMVAGRWPSLCRPNSCGHDPLRCTCKNARPQQHVGFLTKGETSNSFFFVSHPWKPYPANKKSRLGVPLSIGKGWAIWPDFFQVSSLSTTSPTKLTATMGNASVRNWGTNDRNPPDGELGRSQLEPNKMVGTCRNQPFLGDPQTGFWKMVDDWLLRDTAWLNGATYCNPLDPCSPSSSMRGSLWLLFPHQTVLLLDIWTFLCLKFIFMGLKNHHAPNLGLRSEHHPPRSSRVWSGSVRRGRCWASAQGRSRATQQQPHELFVEARCKRHPPVQSSGLGALEEDFSWLGTI